MKFPMFIVNDPDHSPEDAIDLARRNPQAHWGRVEVREVHSFGGPLLGEE